MILISGLVGCKEKTDFEKYNDPSFKLANHPKIQGVYSLPTAGEILGYLGVSAKVWTGSEPCSEFILQKNTLRIRSGLKGTDVEIKIINIIGDEMYFSENGKVARAKLTYKPDGELRKFQVYSLQETDPNRTLATGQGGLAPKGYFEQCLKESDEIMENNEAEAKNMPPHWRAP
ncbi:hypothetical protein CH380_21280 [Leptospira adleri]|uniref:Uncharacterized protein n=2 Tax=Leptospira adleri TaxID=2023186 RepID=A0A2M9YI36_9LEPT|nr:hypothetical protein CH380_21280 [Leptospira adleri]PJZ59506.1 hypothetical protein CH376_23350 [Leptospira adleri]